ncbi:MAG: PKD domain-containing protein, partial [Ginsengibacter sp.]
AGADQVITLPLNSVTLSGVGTDADGTITNYAWTKISGPSPGTITNSNSATTSVTGLGQGIYKFQLKITDNSGAIGLDTVQITVNAALNIPPVADAGADQVITLPLNTITLKGVGTDADGTITSYAWTKISGSSSFAITNPAKASTTVTGLKQGVYKFELQVTDNAGATAVDTMQVLVNPAPNIPPVANAGPDQVITLPVNIVSLAGSGGDVDGTIISYSWTKIFGPTSFTFVNATSPVTDVFGLVTGVYLVELTVTDNNGATAKDTMRITVDPVPNIAPTANAGTDQVIFLPKNRATLVGFGSDADGTVSGYLWTEIAGPRSAIIADPNADSTIVTNLAQGDYLFELQVTDNNGTIGRDTVQITVVASSLPLKLLSFTGKLQNSRINLFWETTNEKNVLGFEIEIMNASSWNNIGFVLANNSGVVSNQYTFTDSIPAIGSNYYRLKIVDIDGKFIYSDIISFEVTPGKNVVYQNFPNSFSDFTNIKFEIAKKSGVKVVVYNSSGMRIAVLLNEIKQPGVYQVRWNAANVAQGNYFYKVIIDESVVTKKMLKVH